MTKNWPWPRSEAVGVRVLNEEVISRFISPESVIDELTSREQKEAERREWLYREGQPTPEVQGRTVIMTHDVWQ